jgi:hypothetical protein
MALFTTDPNRSRRLWLFGAGRLRTLLAATVSDRVDIACCVGIFTVYSLWIAGLGAMVSQLKQDGFSFAWYGIKRGDNRV